jgi:uncharacterized protein YecT (DUF1311 family)
VRISLALAVIVSGVVTPPAIAALRPPIIREPWTPMRCPAHPVSTIDMEACLEKAVTRSDREINASVAKIFFLLHRSADRGAFVRAERQWLQYRRQSCSAEASVYRGGSAQPVAFLACEKRRNIRHLADLRDMKQTLRHG